MSRSSSWKAYRDLDSAADARALVENQRRVAALPPVRDGKEASYVDLRIGSGSRVLDVGCGPGEDLAALCALVAPTGAVVGVDSSKQMASTAEERTASLDADVEVHVADALDLPFADDSFDACRADRALQHFSDPLAALLEMARVVRPGGRVVIVEGRNSVEIPAGADATRLKAVLEGFQESDERKGWIGFMIPLLLQQAGLEDLATEEVSGTLKGAANIRSFYDFDTLITRLHQDGGLDEEGVAAVHRNLDEHGDQTVLTLQTIIFAGSVAPSGDQG